MTKYDSSLVVHINGKLVYINLRHLVLHAFRGGILKSNGLGISLCCWTSPISNGADNVVYLDRPTCCIVSTNDGDVQFEPVLIPAALMRVLEIKRIVWDDSLVV